MPTLFSQANLLHVSRNDHWPSPMLAPHSVTTNEDQPPPLPLVPVRNSQERPPPSPAQMSRPCLIHIWTQCSHEVGSMTGSPPTTSLCREKRGCYETHFSDGDTLTLCLRSLSGNGRPYSIHSSHCLPSPLHFGSCPQLTCMARMLRGMSSRCCRMLKCHVFIRIMSSNMNSRYNRPSTHTWRQACHISALSPRA